MSSQNNPGSVNIATGQPIEQLSDIASQAQKGIGAISALMGAFWSGIDFLWNTIIIGALAWVAYTFMPESWRQQVNQWFGQGMEAISGTGMGQGLFRMIDSVAEWLGMGRPIEGRVEKLTAEQFAQRMADNGLPRNAADALFPHRVALFRQGITSMQDALQPQNARFLLTTLSTQQVDTLFSALRSSGTAEQQQQNRQAINALLQNPDVLRELNTRHPSVIGRLAADTIHSGNGSLDLASIRTLIASPEGLRTLATAIPGIPAATLASTGMTQAQLQSAVSDMQANNPRGQAFRTLINSDALPILGPVLQRLQGAPSLAGAVEALRNPQVREQLNNRQIVDALAQLAPQNNATRALFARNPDGSYPNIQAAQTFAAHLDSGTEQQRAQRTAAIGAVDRILSTGQLPAANSPERAALHTFLGDESNRNALRDFIRTADTSSLSGEQNRLTTLLRGPHGENLLRVFGDAEAVSWLEKQQNPQPQPPANASLQERFSGIVKRVVAATLPTTAAISYSADAPQIIRDNASSIAALREAMPNAMAAAQPEAQPQKTSSLEADPEIAKKVAEVSAGARSAGISNATTAIGTPNVAALASLPQQPREATVTVS